jgi:hypothetical protein
VRRPVNRTLVVLLAAALALALAACGGADDDEDTEAAGAPAESPAEGDAPTPSELAGIWWLDDPELLGGTLLVRFSPDGTFAIDNGGLLDTNARSRRHLRARRA